MSIPFLLSEKPAAVALRLGPENSREAPERFDMEPLARTRVVLWGHPLAGTRLSVN